MVRTPRSSLRSTVRTVAWRGRGDIAHISQRRAKTAIAPEDITQELRGLNERGFREVVTSPLRPDEHHPFLDAGFTRREHLWLLRWRRPAGDAPASPTPRSSTDFRLRTGGGRRHHRAILELDGRSFDNFWRFDAAAFRETRRATRLARVRVVVPPTGRRTICGYATFGLTGTSGYLQRLAVDPDLRRQGLASELVEDGLKWLTSSGAQSCLVNTQEANRSALELYLGAGFEFEPHHLTVLSHPVANKTHFSVGGHEEDSQKGSQEMAQ